MMLSVIWVFEERFSEFSFEETVCSSLQHASFEGEEPQVALCKLVAAVVPAFADLPGTQQGLAGDLVFDAETAFTVSVRSLAADAFPADDFPANVFPAVGLVLLCRTAYLGGVTPFFSPHASRCSGERQQQLVQHCLAVLQPHVEFWQGKG
jgi:hypothetical protein